LFSSVIAIEPESSMIASMFVFGVQAPAAAAPGAKGPARASNELAATAPVNARTQLRFFICSPPGKSDWRFALFAS
jgi:hypothetical protein